MTLIAIIKFDRILDLYKLKSINFPDYVLEKWCSGCKIEFISDNDYNKKEIEINNIVKNI